jgi:hypothetical protein
MNLGASEPVISREAGRTDSGMEGGAEWLDFNRWFPRGPEGPIQP